MSTLDILKIINWICFGCSLFLLHPRNDKPARYLIPVLAVSLAAPYYNHYSLDEGIFSLKNIVVISNLLPAILFILMFRETLGNKRRKVILLGLLLPLTIFTVVGLYQTEYSRSVIYAFTARVIALSIAISMYYIELLTPDQYVFVSREPVFWISAAILLTDVPFLVFYLFYRGNSPDFIPEDTNTYLLMNNILQFIYHGLLFYASLCRIMLRS